MDRPFYNHLFRGLTRIGYEPVRYREELFFRKKQEDHILLLRVIMETLPGQEPEDPDREHVLMEQAARDRMIMEGQKVETLLLWIGKTNPDPDLIRKIQPYEDVWILNRTSGRIFLYENQRADFYGLREWLEGYVRQWNHAGRTRDRKRLANTFTPVNTGIILLNILVFLVLSLMGDTEDPAFIARHGGMVYSFVVEQGKYHLLITSMFIHFGIQHLGQNMLMLLLTGSILERNLGRIRYLILYFGAGLASSVASLAITLAPQPGTVSGGASGAVFGVLGGLMFLVLVNVLIRRRSSMEGLTLRGIMFIILLSAGYGFLADDVDNAAHLGGLVAGFLLCAVMSLFDGWRKNKL